MNDFSQKKHIKNFPCPKCSKTGTGTSAAMYELPDGKRFWRCFESGCPSQGKAQFKREEGEIAERTYKPNYQTLTRETVNTFPSSDLSTRSIREDVAKHFGIKVSHNETTGDVDTHYFPYYIKKELAGYKVRKLPKEFLPSIGSIKGVDPFGWHLLKSAKKLIITEGEYDACILYQVLKDHFEAMGYKIEPQVISLANGAEIKTLLKEKEKQLRKYKEIVLCLDMDETGQKAIQDFAVAYDSDSVKVMELPHKDANETYLEEGPQPIIDSFYAASPPSLGGMTLLRDCLDLAYEERTPGLSYPWKVMTALTEGNRGGELITIGGGTGLGKTDFCTELALHFADTHQMKVCYYSLEMGLNEAVQKLVGKKLGRRLNTKEGKGERPGDREALQNIENNIKFYDLRSGMLTPQHLLYMLKQHAALEDVKVHFIDNLTQLASVGKEERLIINKFIADVKALTEQYDLRVFLISHLNRPDKKDRAFEEGAKTSIHHLFGSSAIEKWSHDIWTIERNTQHSDPDIRNTSLIRRHKGRTHGNAFGLFAVKYNTDTGRMHQCEPVDIIEKDDEGEF